ncbi:MAG: hypothetical protein U0168_23485 [Nannocystaceae bacterium]
MRIAVGDGAQTLAEVNRAVLAQLPEGTRYCPTCAAAIAGAGARTMTRLTVL